MRNPLDFIPHLIVGCIIAGPLLLLVCAIDNAIGTDVTLKTFTGSKSVCVAQQYNYSVKHMVCTQYKTVPAACKTVEHTGPIFGTFTNDRCE